MLLNKIPVYNLFITSRLVFLEKTIVHHLHISSKKDHFFKIIHKTAGHSNSVLSHSTLKNLLQNCKSVSEQIDAFLTYVQLSEQDVKDRFEMCKNIENALKNVFPESSLLPVGSSVSGLGLRGCDLDLSFHYTETDSNSSAQNVVVTNVDISSGKVPTSDFPYLPLKQQLIFIQKVLKESRVTDATTVLPGRFPILNFSCNGLGCDLSINNKFALYGTSLMHACSKLDSRVVPLFQLITYWGKHFNLIGGPLKFKSYAVFLMIIHFLQRRHPSLLPSVQSILLKIDFVKDINNWCSSACEIVNELSPSTNSEDLETLLREFFFYYANFDFTSVICTLDNSLIDGKSFVIKEPAFELNTINVQDPFNFSWNVTTGVDWKNCKSLIKSLLSACEAYHESPDQPVANQNWGLLSILDRPPVDYSYARKENVEINIPLSNVNDKPESLGQICDNVFSVLENCLLFQCHPIDSKAIRYKIDKTALSNKNVARHKKYKFRTSDEKGKRSTFDVENVLFSRSMYVTVSETWRGRSNYVNQNGQDFVSIHRQISKQILEKKMEQDEEKFIFLCECSVVSNSSNFFLTIGMRSANRVLFIPKLRIFLKEYILRYSRSL